MIGQGIFLFDAIRASESPAPAQSGAPTTVRGKIEQALARALGPSDRGARRFEIIRIAGTGPSGYGRDLRVRWAINSGLQDGTVANGAMDDAFLAFQALFTSGLPLSRVELDGTYPMPNGHGKQKEQFVVRLVMDRHTVALIERMGWDQTDAQTVWPLIDRRYVQRDFQPLLGQ